MSTNPLLCATALVALLVSSPAQAGISAFFGGLRATAALDTPPSARCRRPRRSFSTEFSGRSNRSKPDRPPPTRDSDRRRDRELLKR